MPSIWVDAVNRKFVFIWSDREKECSFDEILHYRWDWIDQNGSKIRNKIVFYTSDPQMAVLRTPNLSAEWAEEIFAKLHIYLGVAKIQGTEIDQ